jgi:hypothetical protein
VLAHGSPSEGERTPPCRESSPPALGFTRDGRCLQYRRVGTRGPLETCSTVVLIRLHRADVGGPLLVVLAVMFDGEVVVVEVLLIPEVHADVLVVPVVDDLLLVDVCEVHEVTIVVDGLMGDSCWRPGRPAASVRPMCGPCA